MTPRLARAAELFSLLAACACVPAGAADWEAIPPSRWQGVVAAEAKPLGRSVAAAVALPAKQAAPLVAESAGPCPPGLYEVRLTLRPSHVADAIAFNSRLRVRTDNAAAESAADAEIPMHLFARAHQPETRTIQCLHRKAGPLRVALECLADPRIAEDAWMKAQLGKGGPAPEVSLDTAGGDAVLDDLEIDVTLAPDRAVYFVVDSVEMRPLSTSGLVKALSIDRIRYLPGSTLAGRATVEDVGGRGGDGSLNIFLEHGVQDRTPAASLPVTLGPRPQEIAFEIRLPERELGYAVVATFVSADGRDRAEAAEYFTIAENFQRVAIFGANSRDFGTRDAVLDEPTIRRGIAASRGDYYNAAEFFSWAEDDLIAMSPAVDFWSSGQTNYRQHKQTMQRQMRIAREQGFAMSTYGKFIMSGLPGWEFAYEHPADHRNQYFYPVGMWDMVNVLDLDRRRGGDFCVYGRGPDVRGHPFQGWWSSFLPVNPDATPANVRAAAEECIRSIDMFGWDAIRWDGHPRGGGQCGSSGAYDRAAARKTQALVRYFKEIIGAKHPDFRHGYNYLLIEKEKRHDWAVEDYELDELCRGGGLLMNESIGNASGGWTFAEVARNLQVDGDLCRERGGYYLGISFAKSPRDVLIESGLWAAAGCRPYGAMSREVRRYCTRYAQYTFDERLRRIAAPEKILVPRAETRLWWQPFVYETPLEGGRRQLVVNLFNVPLEARRPPRDVEVKPEWDMPAGSDPVSFDLRLPAGFRPTGAHLVDPQTLAVSPLPMADARVDLPAVAAWAVAVIDLEVTDGAPSLGSLHGPPRTLGVARPGLEAAKAEAEVVIDTTVEVWEVNKSVSFPPPSGMAEHDRERDRIDALPPAERDRALLGLRPTPESLCGDWWKGAALPLDLALKEHPPAVGDLAPVRDGRCDILHARSPIDHRLRMPLAFAGLDTFRVHEALLAGAVRQQPSMGLHDGPGWREYPRFDLVVCTGIPHAALGAENAYGLAAWVKAGGGVLFTGGEYAFGKGGYMHTVLERELLPLSCTEMVDTAYHDPPGTIGPGPDLPQLGVAVDFSVGPAYWVRNRVVLKDGAKLFLESGGRPILVGWQVGRGRVACLLVDHRGRSTGDVTAFFDWKDWPRLVAALLRWLAPDAAKVVTRPAVAAKADDPADDLDDVLGDRLPGDAGGPEEPVVAAPVGEAGERERSRERFVGIAAHAAADRIGEGRRRLAELAAVEEKTEADFRRQCGDDAAIVANYPCLDSEAVLERMAWLTYLSRHDAAFCGPFLREWIRTDLYRDYCDRSAHNAVDEKKIKATSAVAAARRGDWSDLSARFAALRDAARPQAEAALTAHPSEAAAALARSRLVPEIRAAIDLLGGVGRDACRPVLDSLATATAPDLAAFAAARRSP